jgi:arylsulfatase B/arylsulfatase I/J
LGPPHTRRCGVQVGKKYDGVYSLDVFEQRMQLIIAAASTATAPLFLYLAWQNCHDPYDVPQRYIDMYPATMDAARRNMSAMITALDGGLGATVDALKTGGLWGNTLMTVHTDNGGELPYASGGSPGVPDMNGGAGNNHPLRGGKFTLWEAGLLTQGVPGVPQDPLAPSCGPLGSSPDRKSSLGNAPALVPGPLARL